MKSVVTAAELGRIRRLDWRFLLPTPTSGAVRRLRLLGGPSNLADRIVETGLATEVVGEGSPDPVDAVALLHDSPIPLQEAAQTLRPGGVLYWEVCLTGPVGLLFPERSVRTALARAGLDPVGFYAVSPTFEEARSFVPLDVSGALPWFRSTIYTAWVLGHHLRRVAATATHLDPWMSARLLRSSFAVTATTAGARVDAPALLGNSAIAAEIGASGTRPVVLADAGNRVTVLPFRMEDRVPAIVLKVPKLSAFNDRTEREQRVLEQIREGLPEDLARALPEPIGLIGHGEVVVGIERYMPGRQLQRAGRYVGNSVRRHLDDLTRAAAWLADFHQRTEIRRSPWSEDDIETWCSVPFAHFRERLDVNADEERLFGATEVLAQELVGAPLPIVWQHRDFNVWNIFRTENGIAVIDWEGGRPGLPLCDLVHFATHWNEIVRGTRNQAQRLVAFRDLFVAADREDPIRNGVRRAMHDYLNRLQIDPRFVPLLLVYTWVELALRRHQQMQDMGEMGIDPRANNRNLEYLAVLGSGVQDILGSGAGPTSPEEQGVA